MNELSRRQWMIGAGLGTGGLACVPGAVIGQTVSTTITESRAPSMQAYTLPDLPYAPTALEPYLDAKTLTIHHGKHHAGYVKNLNKTLGKLEKARRRGEYGEIQNLSRLLAFHGSGHMLHTLYFGNLTPTPSAPRGALLQAINAGFGSLRALTGELRSAAKRVAGSGWGILAYEPLGRRLLVLQIEKHENQMFLGAIPILALDVWEHAYYLEYRNNRGDYLDAIMRLINWTEVGKRFDTARS